MPSNRICIATGVIAAALGCSSEQRPLQPAASTAELRAPRAPTVTPQISGTTNRFFAVSPGEGTGGGAPAAGGTFARTLDGGRTWVSRFVSGAETLQFRD